MKVATSCNCSLTSYKQRDGHVHPLFYYRQSNIFLRQPELVTLQSSSLSLIADDTAGSSISKQASARKVYCDLEALILEVKISTAIAEYFWKAKIPSVRLKGTFAKVVAGGAKIAGSWEALPRGYRCWAQEHFMLGWEDPRNVCNCRSISRQDFGVLLGDRHNFCPWLWAG